MFVSPDLTPHTPAPPQTLLELGASPDYKDSRGLTPLYHSVVVGGDPGCCELLLNHHAVVCCQDENGWHEVHQVRTHTHAHTHIHQVHTHEHRGIFGCLSFAAACIGKALLKHTQPSPAVGDCLGSCCPST